MRLSLKYTGQLWIVLLLLVGAVATSARADETLRWKFKVGQKLDYNIVQQMNMSISGAPFPKPLDTDMHQEMNMVWDVLGVDDKSGEAVIRQKFERVRMKVNSPLGKLEYDSKSEEPPTGQGAMIAQLYKAMTDGEFEITMTSRGEIKNVKISEQVLAALKSSPAAAKMGDVASADGFKKMMSQGSLVLPKDSPKKGESWGTKVDTDIPGFGKQTIETTYRYEGTKDIKGTMFALIKPQLKMEFEKAAAPAKDQPQQPPEQQQPQPKIKEQTSDGEVLFNIVAGRLQSTSLQQHVIIDAVSNNVPIQQKIDQKIDVTVTPAGEKKADEAKKSEAKKSEAKKPEVSSPKAEKAATAK